MSDTKWLMNMMPDMTDIEILLPFDLRFCSSVSVACGETTSGHFWGNAVTCNEYRAECWSCICARVAECNFRALC